MGKNLNLIYDSPLLGVCEQSLKVAQTLARLTGDMSAAHDIPNLKGKSPKRYEWQDKAKETLIAFRKESPYFGFHAAETKGGFFVVNLASTGCGKTIANAKIMQALSKDGTSLRYVLALGLRTLTLQTGDEYRKHLGVDEEDLAVLIGSSALRALHEKNTSDPKEPSLFESMGSESASDLLEEHLADEDFPRIDFLSAIVKQEKEAALLHKALVVCTIDHLMGATECTRGGKYILPFLRLSSSDLVIDEVDDFDGKDLIAIARLVHLAGMLGRSVMISSATIPPALAEGFLNAYQEGFQIHQAFKGAHPGIACVWVDEFRTDIQVLKANASEARCQTYRQHHQGFIEARVKNIEKAETERIKRKAKLVFCDDLLQEEKEASRIECYFDRMKEEAMMLHQKHHVKDEKTGKKVSFGLVRFANIPPCVNAARHFLASAWDETVTPKIMAYHSRQVLLVRNHQEHYLDEILKRKEKSPLTHPHIRKIIEEAKGEDVLFILVATPVAEVGRDHDYDWAVMEPSSFRSIIQLAGRVQRHRDTHILEPNLAIMQYNLKKLRGKKVVFTKPGYEKSVGALHLKHHNLDALVDEKAISHAINAIPRILEKTPLKANTQLADLEHKAMQLALTHYAQKGPKGLQGWLTEFWWATAFPQQLNRFRESSPEKILTRIWQENEVFFGEKENGKFLRDASGKIAKTRENNSITPAKALSPEETKRLWMKRDYEVLLAAQIDQNENVSKEEMAQKMCEASKKYGEITKPLEGEFEYSDDFGLVQKS